MTEKRSMAMGLRSKDVIWDDCDFPVLPIVPTLESSPAFGFEHIDHTELPMDMEGDLQAALESCGRLMLSFSKGDAFQDPQRILALEQSMRGVFGQLRRLLNRTQPINRLPPEVLSSIFRLATGPVKTTDLRDVLCLSSICHNWRVVIIQDGAMWSNIRLTGQDPMFITQQLERCRGVPLHLSFNMPHTMFQVEGAPFLANFKQIAPIFRVRCSQVKSISATIGGCRAFRQDFGLDWPNLEELVWVDACPAGSRTHEQDPPLPNEDHQTPKLRHLAAKGGLAWETTSITSLTTLKLEGPMNIDLLKFLQGTPQLESLELIKLRVHPSPANTTPIDMLRLTRLVMNNVEHGQLFARVTFPSLRNLTIDPAEYRQSSMEITWDKLHLPLAITALKIEYQPHHHYDRISITGTDRKKNRSFSLTEHAVLRRSAPMVQALCNASLSSVTSLSIGRGVPELGIQLPFTSICALFSGLPHLRRLDLYPSQLSLTVMKHLRSHPLICPVLRILTLTVVRDTCEEVFWLLSGLASDRANSKRWLHRIDCVILRAGGDPHEAKRSWDSLSRHRKFEEYLRCSCVGKNACWEVQGAEMYPTEKASFQRYSYRPHPHHQLEGGNFSNGQCGGGSRYDQMGGIS